MAKKSFSNGLTVAIVAGGLSLAPQAAFAADAYQAALDDVKATFGSVPSFIAAMPRAALPGAWNELKSLLLSPDTTLDPKTKALIAVGVSAAIGCEACVWMDSNEALRGGASQEALREAVAIAGLELHWSAVIEGSQIDLAQIKAELGGEAVE